jgi:hypothetical protein
LAIVSLNESSKAKMRNKIKWTDIATLILTGVIAWAAIAAAVAAICSAWIFQGQLTAARQQIKVDQRAWLSVDVGEETGTFAVRMHNTGKTPALNVTYAVSISGGNLGVIPEVEDILKKANSSTGPPGTIKDHLPTGYVIAPNKSEIASNYGGKFSQAFELSAERAYIQGRITYDDVFGLKHETLFCYWYASPNAFPMCNDHNKMN